MTSVVVHERFSSYRLDRLQFEIMSSTLLLIPGNHTLDRNSCFDFITPRLPSWQMSRTLLLNSCGTTIRLPRKINPSIKLSTENTPLISFLRLLSVASDQEKDSKRRNDIVHQIIVNTIPKSITLEEMQLRGCSNRS